jgi:PhnB protein
MSTPAVKPIPEGMHTLTPHIIVAGAAEAIDFYKKAFNAVEQVRLPGPGGKLMHASLKIGDSTLMLVDEMPDCGGGASYGPKALKGTPVVLHLYVEDADATIAQAEAAGAKVTMPATDMFWGDRYGQVRDPFGVIWAFNQAKR